MGKNGILRTLRLEKRFSKEELSDIFNKDFGLDTDEKLISQWEKGIKTPTGSYLLAYTKIFNISLNYITSLIDTEEVEAEEIFSEEEKQEEINPVKRLREELGLSQEELAEKTGYKSKKKIELIEAGIENIPLSKLAKFAKVLNVSKDIFEKEKNISQKKISVKTNADVILENGQKLYFDVINANKIALHYFEKEEKKTIELNKDELNEFNKSMGIVNILFDSPYVTKSDKFRLKREALKCYIKTLLSRK